MANARIKIFQILQFYFVARGLTPFLIYFRKNSATCQARGCKPWFSLCFEFTYFFCLRNWWNRFIEAWYPFFFVYVTLFWNNRKIFVKLNARQSWVEPKSRWFTHPSPKSLNVLSCFEWKDEFNSMLCQFRIKTIFVWIIKTPVFWNQPVKLV